MPERREEPARETPLVLYNTRTHAKEPFAPIDPAHVRMYVCGPTVYDDAHIGNARPVIVFDVLFRLLRHVYGAGAVTYVRNITDVDDKINARAARDFPGLPLNEAIRRVTEATQARYEAAVAALGNLPPSVEPRATEHIAEMREIIERLVAREVAYVAQGHVLFSVAAMERASGVPRYGSLARRSLDEMIAGARVDVASYKRDEMDFVLWKPSSGGEPGWPSPAGIEGLGRPGWHIECSAMAWKHLVAPFAGRLACSDVEAEIFDIHGGGIDLVFPHHENEVAQSCCAFEIPRMANVWMHNGFLQVEGEKMSKSLGNFVTIADVLKDWPGEVARLAMLKTHYRQPIDWTFRGLEEAERNLTRWYADLGDADAGADADPAVLAALADDLNTPAAVAALHHAAPAGRRAALALMGFSGDPASLARSAEGLDVAAVEALVAERDAARAAKNWAESDRLRDILAGMGVTVKDSKAGTTWEVAR
ncbi:cysteine--tRNA ligase [Salinarimonas ramus]|uniref:Cysteine--tRNA ligase n=1 Tax=Salinarimonas ramus TaxID=690164 RepID=A0A917Q9V1_9HYPH|nr:cysteine--tRNA ligase [Salinarimonas ramus]GGK37233.1 cysteine--tRNA ligase [Salinarimonas ramus]